MEKSSYNVHHQNICQVICLSTYENKTLTYTNSRHSNVFYTIELAKGLVCLLARGRLAVRWLEDVLALDDFLLFPNDIRSAKKY